MISSQDTVDTKAFIPKMNTQSIFCFILALLVSGAHSRTITITNNCAYTIWPGTLTGSGAQLSTTGFSLAPKAKKALTVPSPWSGRFWARTLCSTDSTGKFICATADCGSGQVTCNGKGAVPPATLVEFTIAANNGQDSYDISLVDGFNVPVSVTPTGGSGSKCTKASCTGNVNAVCPSQLQVKGSGGSVIACKSACEAFNQPQYCCTGSYHSSNICKPTNYSMIFKKQCPDAYSYAYDDNTSLLSCTGGANYVITFCP
ncbi:hypothetical protein Pint_35760 [Pistacia integerrima]|uniref:Uncharacterized protein n=1 Tax=Pistacia integerrima TaxID=434235 RepID=A0ACC0Y022_9ROSI|nr:hypothetical protein Pint_35760 [Pistacia integerrima]